MQIQNNYEATAILNEALELKFVADQFRTLLLTDSKVDADKYAQVTAVADSTIDFEVNVVGLRIRAEFGLYTNVSGSAERLRGRYRFRVIDAFGSIDEPFHVLSFDKAGQTGLREFSSLMYGNELVAKSIRNAHLFGIAKAAIATLPTE